MIGAHIFTQHGQTREVPNLKGLQLSEAIAVLDNNGFKWEISDSVYNDNFAPGAVIEQNPKASSHVKSMRTIYLIVSPTQPRTITMPQIKEISARQGQSILEGLGFKNIQIVTVHSPFDGLILSVTVNGREVAPGTKLLPSTMIQLSVGSGNGYASSDSISDPDSDLIGSTDDSLF